MKHRHGLVTDCHHLPMVPIVPQSAPMVSVADVSVKLYMTSLVIGNEWSVFRGRDLGEWDSRGQSYYFVFICSGIANI